MTRSLGLALLSTCLLAPFGACGGRSSDDADTSSSGEATGESGESGGLWSDAELREVCEMGCVRFETCAPETYMQAYADDQACADYCYGLFDAPDACRAAAPAYQQCTGSLPCEDWPALLDDPANTDCAASWSVVLQACEVPG